MSENGNPNPTVVRTSRGLTVGGSRLTIYQLMDHFKAGHTDELVQEWYRLTADQVADIHAYIAEHRDDVEAEYQEVLRNAERNRRYWEERNKPLFEKIKNTPPTPEQAARLAKLEETSRETEQSMIGLLADHNAIQQAELIWSVFTPAEWQALGIESLRHFSDVGLEITATDREIWLICQASSLFLLTGNRNADGDESLEAAIADLNSSQSLPVLTIGDLDQVLDYSYREDCAYRIADFVARVEDLLGSARLYIP